MLQDWAFNTTFSINKSFCVNWIKTDDVIAHVTYWILKSTGENNDNYKVPQLSLHLESHVHRINNLIQQELADKHVF